jgi:hypothetical protein
LHSGGGGFETRGVHQNKAKICMNHTADKLRRRMESTDALLAEELLRDDGYDYDIVEKRLDKYLKAVNEYYAYCHEVKFGSCSSNAERRPEKAGVAGSSPAETTTERGQDGNGTGC